MSKFENDIKQSLGLGQNSMTAYDADMGILGGGNTSKRQDPKDPGPRDSGQKEAGFTPGENTGFQRDRKPRQNSSGLNAPGGSASPIIGATALLAAKYPSHFTGKNDRRSRLETRVVMLITAALIGLIAYGWSTWSQINFRASFDFTYNSGLIGGILMLLTLLYALRKRIKILKKLGGMEGWYYFHLIGGVVGPFVIIFHSAFSLRSINSTMAFIAMMLVVVSGLFGRYIYTRIGYGLHSKIDSIKETESTLIESIRKYDSDFVESIERRLSTFALACLAGPKSFIKLPLRFLAIRAASATCYVTASEDMSKMLKIHAQDQAWTMQVYKNLLDEEKRLLREHINAVVQIAHVHVYERILVRWRILHIPLLYILFITGCAHVLAVHMY
ncbi:MAG: hypothetical protein AMJ53_17740 [Gammaproteobacteria bacterium SG8_11]|nr:MAG: hypothetical protein AMJ53_17740 [Gammaproteobacteria bacterium SG8_11]